MIRYLCKLISMDMICALGVGAQEVWISMLNGNSGLHHQAAYATSRLQEPWVAEVDDEYLCGFDGMNHVRENGRCFRMAAGIGKRVLGQGENSLRDVPPKRLGLVLSSLKGEMADMEQAACRKPGRRHFILSTLAEELALTLGVEGPVMTVSNACASGLVAITQAARLIQSGQADLMLVVGVEALSHFIVEGFASLQALATGPCRPFDQCRNGLCLGEGAGGLLLASPQAFHGPALAQVIGWGISNDASHITAPARNGAGLRSALTNALAMAGIEPGDVDFINAHGTGTVYNDEMEARAFYQVFGEDGPPTASFKGYLGHTLGAAGILEAILCVMALGRAMAPASWGFSQLGVSRPLNILKDNFSLVRAANVVTVKSGFGGINAALVLSSGDAQ